MARTHSVKMAILKAFRQHKQLTWTQLLEKSGVSKGALSKYLNKMISEGYIKTKVDKTKRPPTTFYSITKVSPPQLQALKIPATFEEYKAFISAATASALREGYKISILKDRNTARDILKEYLHTNLRWVVGFISVNMVLAYAYSRGWYKARAKKPKPSLQKKQFDVYITEVRKDMRDLIEPWVNALASTLFFNSDIASDGKGVFADVAREFVAQVDVDWFDILEKHMKAENYTSSKRST